MEEQHAARVARRLASPAGRDRQAIRELLAENLDGLSALAQVAASFKLAMFSLDVPDGPEADSTYNAMLDALVYRARANGWERPR